MFSLCNIVLSTQLVNIASQILVQCSEIIFTHKLQSLCTKSLCVTASQHCYRLSDKLFKYYFWHREWNFFSCDKNIFKNKMVCSDEIAHCVTGVGLQMKVFLFTRNYSTAQRKHINNVLCTLEILFPSFRIISTHTDNSNLKIRLDSSYKKFISH